MWLDSAEQVWVDVIVPTGHHLWSSDVTESFAWLGRAWVRTALAVGVNEPISIHVGRLESSDWSDLLCFAGRGPGEVFVRNRKLVGISQRRSRAGALFQCGILTRWTFDPQWFSAAARPNTVDSHVMHAGIGLGELVEPLEPPDLPARVETAFVDAVLWVDSQVDSQPSRSDGRPRGELASS